MSGQIVGEVIAASGSLRARGLPARAFHALVAIAEKAGVHDREASVRWDHIRAGLYGASKRTAERAVDDLKAAGLVSIVRPGFKNQHSAQAPVYRVLPLTDHDTQVSVSRPEDHDTQVSVSERVDTDKPSVGYRQNGVGYRHPGVVLDGSLDGFLDGGTRVDHEPRCPKHADPQRFPIPPNCIGCKQVRDERDKDKQMRSERERAERALFQRAREECTRCRGTGQIEVTDNSVARCPECTTPEARQRLLESMQR